MQGQILKVLFYCLVGVVIVSSVKDADQLPKIVQPKPSHYPVKPFKPPPQFSTSSYADPRRPGDHILKQQSEINPDGSYHWSYETLSGIKAEETGTPFDLKDSRKVATGSFEYTAPDGTPIAVKYIADENGFLAEGAHLPTPPPIPIEIARALKWIAAHPQSNK